MSELIFGKMLRDINSKLGDAKEGIFQLHHEDKMHLEKPSN